MFVLWYFVYSRRSRVCPEKGCVLVGLLGFVFHNMGGKGGGIMLYIVICLFHEEDLVKERWRGNGYNGLFN